MDDDMPLNPDSPKRHSDPAPCTSEEGSPQPSTSSAFTFSVPDLRCYSGSPKSSPVYRRGRLKKQTQSQQQTRRYSHSSCSPNLGNFTRRRATHPNASPARYRRASQEYQSPLPNGDDKPFGVLCSHDHYRLRSFSVTSKGVVNLGDLMRARSPSVTSDESSSGVDSQVGERLSLECGVIFSPPLTHSILLLGSEEVGKSSLLAQFTTSECLTTVITDMQESLDGCQERIISLLVDGEETELSCEDPNESTYEVDECTFATKDAFLLVYSVTDRNSLTFAVKTLEKLRRLQSRCHCKYLNLAKKVVILVANKSDLARSRIVSREEGRCVADKYDAKYIETSVGFNHNVDELLVGVVTQIRLKKQQQKQEQAAVKNLLARSVRFGHKAKDFMDKFLQKCDLKAKSCDNLHVP